MLTLALSHVALLSKIVGHVTLAATRPGNGASLAGHKHALRLIMWPGRNEKAYLRLHGTFKDESQRCAPSLLAGPYGNFAAALMPSRHEAWQLASS